MGLGVSLEGRVAVVLIYRMSRYLVMNLCFLFGFRISLLSIYYHPYPLSSQLPNALTDKSIPHPFQTSGRRSTTHIPSTLSRSSVHGRLGILNLAFDPGYGNTEGHR